MNSFPMNSPINPFESAVVRNPKECGGSVASLNKPVLDRITQRFLLLTAENVPKYLRRPAAQLVLSPSPGYGKSHLIGRLYHELGGMATIVHQTPFQSPALVWQAVLNHTVNELCSIDESQPATGRWKIETFANSVICRVTSEILRRGLLLFSHAAEVIAMLESGQVSLHPGTNHPLALTLREIFLTAILPLVGDEVFGIRASRTWSTAFFHLAGAGREDEAFRASVAWLRYEPFETEHAEAFGFQNRVPAAENLSQINQECWLRLLGLCRWSYAFRPFLFCFDQTEDYASRPELAMTLGTAIRRMTDELPGQLTLVTANQDIWQSRIWSFIDSAGQARFDLPPLELKGVRRIEAREFIRVKMHDAQVPDELSARFAEDPWLDELFPGNREIAAREFMRLCRARWDNQPPRPETPDSILQRHVAEFEATAKKLVYDPDAFRWLVSEILPADGTKAEPAGIAGLPPYAELVLPDPEGNRLVFAFFRELQHQQWRFLVAQSERAYDAAQLRKLVIFRTPEQAEIPRPGWAVSGPIIREGLRKHVHLIHLEVKEVALLYAAREFYLEARAGDLPHFDENEVRRFLRDRLSGLCDLTFGPVLPPRQGGFKAPAGEENELDQRTGEIVPPESPC
ncbi:MAG: hypothetical protein JO015_21130 [Verrucomicrobia bacterium]|nr:hypothetical protein [Verrucomicrobiota bacterium]